MEAPIRRKTKRKGLIGSIDWDTEKLRFVKKHRSNISSNQHIPLS